jgi:outer membrane protein W
MKQNMFEKLEAMAGFALLASLIAIPQARSELIYDEGTEQKLMPQSVFSATTPDEQQTSQQTSDEQQTTEDRATLRQVLKSSQRADDTVQSESIRQAPTPIVQQPHHMIQVASTQVVSPEIQNLTKSELMRRERVREELKNEDILQERLEELRLRDERNRVGQLFGTTDGLSETSESNAALTEQKVVSPITERPGQVIVASASGSDNVALGSLGQTDQINVSQASSTSNTTMVMADERARLSIAPRGGLSNMAGSQLYNIQSRYTAGLGFDIGVSSNLSFELGYAFSEYGVALTSTNPTVVNYQYYTGNSEPLAMKQNVLDAGLKVYLLGEDAKLRPFLGASAGYSKSFINYDQRIIDELYRVGYQNLLRDYEVSSFLGAVSAGFDVRLSKDVSVGTVFKYHTVLTARENQNLNNAAFYGYGYNPYAGYGYSSVYGLTSSDAEKQVLGGSLARSSFYSVLAGVSFNF